MSKNNKKGELHEQSTFIYYIFYTFPGLLFNMHTNAMHNIVAVYVLDNLYVYYVISCIYNSNSFIVC